MRLQRCLMLFAVSLAAACSTQPKSLPGRAPAPLELKQIVKGDVDRVADAHRRAAFESLQLLAQKLYRRNPRELSKSASASAQAVAVAVADPLRAAALLPAGLRGTEAVAAGFKPEFAGDRVAALIGGLAQMTHDAFDGRDEFYILDELDPQKLYNAARNVEIATWKLAASRDAGGRLLLLSNDPGTASEPPNLSFEREFGKLIGNLDLLAVTIAERDNRTLARIAQNLATAVFLPVAAIR